MLQRRNRLNIIGANNIAPGVIGLGIITLGIIALLGLSACGQKGPLYLEGDPQNKQTQQTDLNKDKPDQK